MPTKPEMAMRLVALLDEIEETELERTNIPYRPGRPIIFTGSKLELDGQSKYEKEKFRSHEEREKILAKQKLQHAQAKALSKGLASDVNRLNVDRQLISGIVANWNLAKYLLMMLRQAQNISTRCFLRQNHHLQRRG